MRHVAFGPSLLLLVILSLIPGPGPAAALIDEARGELEELLQDLSEEAEETRARAREKLGQLAELRSLLHQLGDSERRAHFEMELDAMEARILEAVETNENVERARGFFEGELRETVR